MKGKNRKIQVNLTLSLSILIFSMFFHIDAIASAKLINIGKFYSRGIWTQRDSKQKMPAVIIIPGSGPHGPEAVMPPEVTRDRKSTKLSISFSEPFLKAHWNVLCLGKPGIEATDMWNPDKMFYNKDLYMHLRWQQLIENLAEGIKFLRAQPEVDQERIFILGHSQGTQIAVDYALQDPKLAGLILLGFSGEDYKTILDWQLFKRPIEHFVATDVDRDHDGFVSKDEAAKWPGPINIDGSTMDWHFRAEQNKISYADIEENLRAVPENQKIIKTLKDAPFLAGKLFSRGPIYKKAASLALPIYVFTGADDLLTPPKEALELKRVCELVKKKNCRVNIVPGLGHGFSPPRGPRKHPLLDITVGPVESGFLQMLETLIHHL